MLVGGDEDDDGERVKESQGGRRDLVTPRDRPVHSVALQDEEAAELGVDRPAGGKEGRKTGFICGSVGQDGQETQRVSGWTLSPWVWCALGLPRNLPQDVQKNTYKWKQGERGAEKRMAGAGWKDGSG